MDFKNIKSWKDIKELHLLKRGKKHLLKLLYGRTLMIGVMLGLQVWFFVLVFMYLDKIGSYMYWGAMVITICSILHLFNNRMDPTVKMTWLFIIAIFSPFGSLLYVITMLDWGHRKLKKQFTTILCFTSKTQASTPQTMEAIRRKDKNAAHLAQYLISHGGYRPYPADRLKYYPLGEDFLPDFLEDLASAKHFIFLEYFIIDEGEMWGKVLYVLSQKAKEGVEVRLMYDGMNEFSNLPHKYPKMLEALGIQCHIFDPIKPFVSTAYNYRDHRKIAVIDGKTAYTGGVNLADEYINAIELHGHWKDVAIRLHGDGVATFTRVFLEDWNYREKHPMPKENVYIQASSLYGMVSTKAGQRAEAAAEAERDLSLNHHEVHQIVDNVIKDGFVIPYADNPLDADKVGEQVYMDILNTATKYVHIMTPYLILDATMKNALMYAAKRGIDVKLILPHIPDKRYAFVLAKNHYPELLEAGVKIYEYTPGFVHAKVFTSDDHKATVGSINLDYRSFYHHFENGMYVDGNPVVADIEQDFRDTLAKCEEITLEKYKHGGFLNAVDKVFGVLFKLIAPMM